MSGSVKSGGDEADFEVEIDIDRWSAKKVLEVKYSLNSPWDTLRRAQGSLKAGVVWSSWRNWEVSGA